MEIKDKLVIEEYRSTRHEVLLCIAGEIAVWIWSLNKMIDMRSEPEMVAVIAIGYIWMRAGLGYLMHRCGAFHIDMEAGHEMEFIGYEHVKPTGLMPIIGVGASLPQFLFYIYGMHRLYTDAMIVDFFLYLALGLLGVAILALVPRTKIKKIESAPTMMGDEPGEESYQLKEDYKNR
ncbi:MAG TPA: hypothetical protein VF974_05825 [Patescibacteria group bacterium]